MDYNPIAALRYVRSDRTLDHDGPGALGPTKRSLVSGEVKIEAKTRAMDWSIHALVGFRRDKKSAGILTADPAQPRHEIRNRIIRRQAMCTLVRRMERIEVAGSQSSMERFAT